ncbi:SgcJ/EcaC family oxidoreductase [Pusillimonas sp. ANT_WB101]|nr:SgcJ/EcaC family oxidoreductase [Pusillimonas sp. ANT_WB101]
MDAKTHSARAEIVACLDSWSEAVKTKNVEAVLALYLPDVVAFDAIQALQFKGIKAYGEHWEKCMAMCPLGMVFEASQREIQLDGNLAVVHELVHCGTVDEQGKEEAGWARKTASLRKVDGHWLIAHEHFSVPFDMLTGRVMNELDPNAETAGTPRAIPDGMNAITPHLVCKHADQAIAFYKNAFGATEQSKLVSPDGSIMHACLRIAGSPFFLMEDVPKWGATSPSTLGGTPVSLHVYVGDADAAFAKAVAAGAKVIMAPGDMFWGDRYSLVEDPFGHRWSLATHKHDLSHEEIMQAASSAMQADIECPASAS